MVLDMRTERTGNWRDAATLPALFVASFIVTYWAIRPAAAVHSPQWPEVRPAATGANSIQFNVAPPPTAATESDPDMSGQPATPAPTLQELATDNDPETREEAQVLLALLDQEQVGRID